MDWTTTRPTVVGEYWVRFGGAHWTVSIKAHFNGDLFVYGIGPLRHYGAGDEQVLRKKYEWYGPMVPPA